MVLGSEDTVLKAEVRWIERTGGSMHSQSNVDLRYSSGGLAELDSGSSAVNQHSSYRNDLPLEDRRTRPWLQVAASAMITKLKRVEVSHDHQQSSSSL
ncbi:unnamed protein product [Mycena citricolor]|uniref:Uncharacterized protein n=1 Tax=Mycena citricolor TaxID=2018698 RepID=A0AAD2Q6Z2_9AGAR|nr:unnamed protein product [Mycena citricolor]